MFKQFASSLVIACTLSFVSSPLVAQSAGAKFNSQARAVSGSNPLPQAVSGSNPLPQAVSGSNPLPQAVSGSNPLPQAVSGSNPLPQVDAADDDQDDDNWIWTVLAMWGIY